MVALLELFDKAIDVEYKPDVFKDTIRGTFSIDDKVYVIDWELHTIEDEVSVRKLGLDIGEEVWYVSFFLSKAAGKDVYGYSNRYGNTGAGNQFLVYSTVIKGIEKFIDQYKPKNIAFTGDSNLGKGALYSKMVNKVVGKLTSRGYTVTSKNVTGILGDHEVLFVLRKV